MSYPDPSSQLLEELRKSVPDPSIQPTLKEYWNPIADDVGSSKSSHDQTTRPGHRLSPTPSSRASVTSNQSGFSHRQTTRSDRSTSPPPSSRASVNLSRSRFPHRQTSRSDHSPTPPPPYSACPNSYQSPFDGSGASVPDLSSPNYVDRRPLGGKYSRNFKVQFYKDGAEWNANDPESGKSSWTCLGESTEAYLNLTTHPDGALAGAQTTVFVPDHNGDGLEAVITGTMFDLASVGRYEMAMPDENSIMLFWGMPDQGQLEGRSRYTTTHAVKRLSLFHSSLHYT